LAATGYCFGGTF
jgi:dienelactone hydrolase